MLLKLSSMTRSSRDDPAGVLSYHQGDEIEIVVAVEHGGFVFGSRIRRDPELGREVLPLRFDRRLVDEEDANRHAFNFAALSPRSSSHRQPYIKGVAG